MKADTLLNNAANGWVLYWVGCNRGFITENCDNSTASNLWTPQIDYELLNQGKLFIKNLTIRAPFQIYTIEGKIVENGIIHQDIIDVSTLAKGAYILEVKNSTLKFLR